MKPEEKQQLRERAEALLSEQNFVAAITAGVVAAALASFAYAIITYKWPFTSGFAAVGIGIAVGFAMQMLGRGIEQKFAVVAAILTIAGCAFGNSIRETLFSTPGDLATRLRAVRDIELSTLLEQSMTYATSFDIVFWLIAVWFAAFLVKRPLSRSDRLAIGMSESRQ